MKGPRQRSPEELEMQPNGDAPLLRDDHARRKWVSQELSACCEVRRLPPLWTKYRIPELKLSACREENAITSSAPATEQPDSIGRGRVL